MTSPKTKTWQTELIEAVTCPEELIRLLELDPSLLPAAKEAAKRFPLKVPRHFVARMQKGNVHDPLLQQVLPIHDELTVTPGYVADPLDEKTYNPIPGVLHKYHGRVLLTVVGTCAINCRYCFRRHFPYENNNPGKKGWERALQYIRETPSLSEVILSGGDPLVADDDILKKFVEDLAQIPHVTRLRIHTRLPIVLPSRITPELVAWTTATRLKIIVVTHSNHPHEINPDVRLALRRLSDANIPLLNQTVLLKGINDSVELLCELSETLFSAGILPYYLHVLDKVQGAAHFDMGRKTAKELHWGMSQRLSGYLVPKLVCEQPGAPAKLSLESGELYTA